ncbi:hypothetical protein OsI_36732 [Oryza sativa Indica Group]|uniref:DUF3741 domain-containing protein n=1 Tax=Oryza sativa subsp. indica TaxID=39946 RepID=B8BLE5_ORYSI|nr:hypothetical protein OsI_36732 [Oryza sativa Indica Group]
MVAMGADEEEERRMHQGCMAGFFHLFDRPQILSGKRLHHQPRRLLSSSSGSATPSERSMQLDRSPERATPLPSPDMTPPAAPRPSLQLPPLETKDGGGAPAVWRLPRLSLDSRAVVDARGKLRPRDIRTSPAAPPSPGAGGGDERRSPSVVARLMGLDALPRGAPDERDAAPCGGELRRSASERVPRDPACFRFVDPSFFERPSPPVTPQQQRPSSPAAEAALRRAPDPACPRGAIQRRSRFDAHDVFPEPAKRVVDSAAAGHGEIALYGEIERRLRKRGIAEPARDLETLKQILEALQLKGLLRHTPPPPVSSLRTQPPPPPIVVMRPSSRPPQPPASRTSPTRRVRVDADNARRPRSPDRAASPARSPASPARRGPQSPQRRVSPAQSPRYQPPLRKPSTGDRSRIARRGGHGSAALSPDDDASTTFSDGTSSGSLSASSRWDFEVSPPPPPPMAATISEFLSSNESFAMQQRARPDELRTDRGLLERCGKLLSSIQAFTAGDDQQPSPVSVLDAAAFLADEDSPSSSGSKRAIFFGAAAPAPHAATASASDQDDDDDQWDTWTVGPDVDPDYAYVAEVVKVFDRTTRDPSAVYAAAAKTTTGGDDDTCPHHRMLLCAAAVEALDRRRAACAWDPVSWLRGGELVDHVWAEVRRAREPVAAPDADLDLNELIRGGVVRDLAADHHRWPPSSSQLLPGAEVADAVLQIERLVFKDLVADTIRELADVGLRLPRRKLVF